MVAAQSDRGRQIGGQAVTPQTDAGAQLAAVKAVGALEEVEGIVTRAGREAEGVGEVKPLMQADVAKAAQKLHFPDAAAEAREDAVDFRTPQLAFARDGDAAAGRTIDGDG